MVDSDRLGHEELGAPEVVSTLRQWWGASVCGPSGEVDRKKVGEIVFVDPVQRTRLENLLYPRIRRRREEIVAACDADPSVRAIVLDTPKLFETGLNELCDAVIFIEADWPVRVRRVADSRSWTEEELRRRENLQDPLDMKKSSADYTVINQAGIDVLKAQVERVLSSVPGFFK